jgi:hypothetical protein
MPSVVVVLALVAGLMLLLVAVLFVLGLRADTDVWTCACAGCRSGAADEAPTSVDADGYRLFSESFREAKATEMLLTGSISVVKEVFGAIPDDWSKRHFYTLALSRSFPIEALEDWASAEPESADAHLVCGARKLKIAWDARGYGRGHEVDPEAWERFYALLDEARASLTRSAELNPRDPTPWTRLITVACYRSEPDEERNAFEEAVSRDRDNWHAHMSRLIGVSKKYGGSHEGMFEFARTARRRVSSDSLLNCLVLKAHSEYLKYQRLFEQDHDAYEAHRTDPQVIAECLDAYGATLASGDYCDYDSLLPRINAAGTLWLLRQREPLRAELTRLGKRHWDRHWRWVGCEEQLREAREFAGV